MWYFQEILGFYMYYTHELLGEPSVILEGTE